MNYFEVFKNTPLRVVFSTLFSVSNLVMKHCVLRLIYYFSNSLIIHKENTKKINV